jgi:hypothetical protein
MAQASSPLQHITPKDIDDLSAGLAAKAQISPEQARRVLDVLGLDKMVRNYQTAALLVQNDLNMSALGIPKGAKALPDFKFDNLGIAMIDHTCRVGGVPR